MCEKHSTRGVGKKKGDMSNNYFEQGNIFKKTRPRVRVWECMYVCGGVGAHLEFRATPLGPCLTTPAHSCLRLMTWGFSSVMGNSRPSSCENDLSGDNVPPVQKKKMPSKGLSVSALR